MNYCLNIGQGGERSSQTPMKEKGSPCLCVETKAGRQTGRQRKCTGTIKPPFRTLDLIAAVSRAWQLSFVRPAQLMAFLKWNEMLVRDHKSSFWLTAQLEKILTTCLAGQWPVHLEPVSQLNQSLMFKRSWKINLLSRELADHERNETTQWPKQSS